jgi:hypothetical protein
MKLNYRRNTRRTNILLKQAGQRKKRLFKIKGIFMQSDMRNKNGRVYPKDVLQREVAKI